MYCTRYIDGRCNHYLNLTASGVGVPDIRMKALSDQILSLISNKSTQADYSISLLPQTRSRPYPYPVLITLCTRTHAHELHASGDMHYNTPLVRTWLQREKNSDCDVCNDIRCVLFSTKTWTSSNKVGLNHTFNDKVTLESCFLTR